MQAPADLTDWLRDYGFHREAVAAVESMAFKVEPTLAITQANVNALQSVLRMEKAQVRLVRALDAAAACCARASLFACACTAELFSVQAWSCCNIVCKSVRPCNLVQM